MLPDKTEPTGKGNSAWSAGRKENNVMRNLLYTIFGILTGMIGYQIHGSLFWAIVNVIFAPLSWVVWLINHSVTLSVLKATFSWFFV